MKGVIKTEADIVLLRESGTRLAIVVKEVSRLVRPGVSTAELNKRAEELIRAGGDTPSFLGYTPRGAKRPYPSSICISVNEEVVHGIPNENPHVIKNGDIVSLDCGITHRGMVTDHAISVIAGKGDTQAEALLAATKEALYAGIGAARAGNTIGDISAAIEAVGAEAGYGIVYELGGHGVGYAVHEEPYIPNIGGTERGETLSPGMVLAIEPMFTEGTSRARGTPASASARKPLLAKVSETLSSASFGRHERARSRRSSLAKVQLMPDGYTFVTRDGSRAAHFEHTILVTENDPEILTVL